MSYSYQRAPIIIGALFLMQLIFAQPKNTSFSFLEKLNNQKQLEIIYDDSDLADTYAEELSLQLQSDLSTLGINVSYRFSLASLINQNISLKEYTKSNSNYIFLIRSQASSTRNTLSGIVYKDGVLIGNFKSFRTIWNNNRIISLSNYISTELKKKTFNGKNSKN